MDPSHGPELADDLEKSRQKRSRTGCLTCRNRRRKCDEGKPRCQNCISKGLECKHAAAFQILGKNNFTPALPSEGKEGYAELQFVPENGDKGDNKKRKNNAKGGTDIPGAPSPDLGLAGPQLASPNDDRSFEGLQGARSHSPSTERYEFALHGLLALGSANGGDVEECEADYGTMVLPESQNVALPNDANVILNRARQESNANNAATMQATPSMSALSSVSIPQMASEHVLECFRHYRYNIAPWMDICDMSQCFGGEVLQLSMASPEIHCEILALAEASIDARQRLRSLGAGMLPSMQQDNDNSTINAHQRLADLLHIVRAVVTNLSEFWNREDATRSMQQVLEPALVDVNKNPSCKESLTPARFWLTARLQLSVALLSPSTVRIPLPTSYISDWEYASAGNAERVFRYAHDAVALCIDATIFSRGDEDRWLQQQYGLNRIDLWKTLVAGFDRWYKHRPEDFQPIIELYPRDGVVSEDGFPTLVFSSGAAALANQLYHTGMLLLLQHKPRFMDRPHSQSPSGSTLWHVHRVCGIALSNDRWDYWDPSLVASLLVAAKTVTHESQHKAILDTLENVQRLTGWNIAYHVDQLALE